MIDILFPIFAIVAVVFLAGLIAVATGHGLGGSDRSHFRDDHVRPHGWRK